MRPTQVLRMGYRAVFLLFICMGILSSCRVVKQEGVREPAFYPDLDTKSIEIEISRLEEAVESKTDPSSRANALFHLALLYSHHRNPMPDYTKALSNLQEYAFFDPECGQTDDVQYLLSLLTKITELRDTCNKLRKNIGKLRNENKRLRKDTIKTKSRKHSINTLKRENVGLRERYQNLWLEYQKLEEIINGLEGAIQKLKELDMRLEKKKGIILNGKSQR